MARPAGTERGAGMSATHAPVEAKPPSGVARYVPILQWLPKYQGRFLTGDVVAAVTVWALLVPEAMAYAAVAGVPVQYGLYAAALAGLAYMIFGSSRKLFFGPDAAPAAVSAGVVVGVVGAHASVAKYVSLTAVLALLVGLIFIVLGLLRLGWISKFFAEPVLTGFVFGLGWFIAVGQLPKVVGLHKPSGDTVKVLVETIAHIGDWKWATVATGVIALVALFAMSRFAPKLPAAIIVVILGILAVNVFNLATKHGVKIVGAVPSGFHFASWSQVSWHDVYSLIPGAFALMLVAFSQSVALAKAYATEYHEPLDVNQEMFGYGAGNLASGGLQGFATCGSLSKSAVAQQAGAKTPLNLGVTSVLVIVTILFLTGLFKNLPEAVLGAIIIHAVSGSMKPGKLVRLWRANRGEFVLAALAAAGVILINILPGIAIGVLASFFLLIRRLDHPRTTLMGRSPDQHYYVSLNGDPDVKAVPGTLIYAFRAPLLFTNNEDFSRDLLSRIDKADPQPGTVVLDCDAISETDTTGSDALRQVHSTLDAAHIRLLLARVDKDVMEYLKRDGVLGELGHDVVFPTVREAVDADKAVDAGKPR
jgi:high affinity sulfate transporter 1